MADLDSILKRHPWPQQALAQGAAVDWLFHYDLPVSAAAIWPHLSDTARINRAMGREPWQVREEDGRLHATTKIAFLTAEWVEQPWSWVSGSWLEIIREYRKGIAHWLRSVFVVESLDEDRVRVSTYWGWIPRGGFARFLLGLGKNSFEAAFGTALAEIAAQLNRPGAERRPLERPTAEHLAVASHRLSSIGELLEEQGVGRGLVDRLFEHISRGDDMEVLRLRVLALAERWQVDDAELLRACLHATRAGLLLLSWDVVCPHCRGVRRAAEHLGDVPPRESCGVCEIDFETDDENAIEITFRIHPSIRQVEPVVFCAAEAATKRHVHVQQRLQPGASIRVETVLRPGQYRARVDGHKHYSAIEVRAGAEGGELRFSASDSPTDRVVAPSPVLELTNDSDHPATLVLEETLWANDSLRPGRLLSLQEFRDIFTEESLGADIQLSVGQQTILFTDIVGSSRFYGTRGDPGAFREVRRHFTEVYEEVSACRGAVVKTIGDAAMAAFADPLDALKATTAIQRRFHPDRDDTVIRIRATLNTGSCIAVNLNTGIDYFGHTVNLAAKIQAVANAGEIALTDAVLEAPGVRRYLEEQGARLEQIPFETKALADGCTVHRWNVHAKVDS